MKRVYFIGDHNNHVKIGISGNPGARLASLQTGTAHKLGIIHTQAGTDEDEAFLHNAFSDLRAVGEWFRIEDRLLYFISFLRTCMPDAPLQDAFVEYVETLPDIIAEKQYGSVLYEPNGWADAVQAG